MSDDQTPAVVLARFVCSVCGSELMTVEKPADQEPGPVTIAVPRAIGLSCRVCLQKMHDENTERLAAERLRRWPGSSSVN